MHCITDVYFDIQQLVYSRMNKFAARSSAALLLLVVVITVVSATPTKRSLPQDDAEPLAARPEKVKTFSTTGN